MCSVRQRPNDPYIYLKVMGEWYCYNPADEPLGSGAMGTVYRGYRCKNGGIIAVKRVNDSYSNNKDIRSRAKFEASLAFRHPNLVEMIGYCEYMPDRGPIFLLSNLVQGKNIDDFAKQLDTVPDRVERMCKCIYGVLDALDYIHSKGIIHRDIKPSNIMVEDNSNVRLMDLGIARLNGGNAYSRMGFIGTPEYAAPEQILREVEGSSAQINETTDIYQLGITFYELLSGKNPMACDNEADTIALQMKSQLPSSPRIPAKLMKVLLRATEKDQGFRYKTAMEFKAAIQDSFIPDPPLYVRVIQWFTNLFNG